MSVGVPALADRFFAAVTARDIPALDSLYGPDAVVWHNYDDVEQDRDDSLRLLGQLARAAGPMRYTEVRRIVLEDGFVQQHVVELGGRCEGLRMPAMLRVWCDDRHIHRIEEYVDPGPLTARLAATARS
ncbi:nuclear transport factor 2 family protein [Streptomyces sp. NPDC057611]|uniref:nuclear transport factor 2 family protein n=1 Tax=Streptomyces sp. NPDC057611 TaxID=3346182 RepID=UPI0036CA1889